jgi:transcription initiation factor TFIIIB Brf1 subunit/transcription initiation factor TFIIB
MPLTVAWPSEDVYVGLGQSEALEHLQLKHVDDVLNYMQELGIEDSVRSMKIRPLLMERDRLIRQGKSIDGVLSELILLKEEQRKIHRMIKVVEKVKNCLHVKPCVIDYGVNFGLKSVETLWRQNLMRNDNLMLPTVLSTKD